MEQFTNCPKCHKLIKEPYFTEQYRDIECPEGHKFRLINTITNYPFYIDESMLALLVGDYNVAYFYVFKALETFRLDFVKYYLYTHEDIPLEVIEKNFKHSTISQEIIGAFNSAHLSTFKKPSPFSKRAFAEIVTVRNRLVHSTILPTKEETEKACYTILELIYEIQENYKKSFDINLFFKKNYYYLFNFEEKEHIRLLKEEKISTMHHSGSTWYSITHMGGGVLNDDGTPFYIDFNLESILNSYQNSLNFGPAMQLEYLRDWGIIK
ncbi:hypothetical protein PGRAN_02435 [Listeria grandensis FSL F6-0971]|uniref:Uncharacterized protein n=1 Tax=Listeria grandensis FSL F6-0971 TaxID=1265819 RepID=W7BNU7_9LIST|nr:hypothetical protein [Listeria grandensis]EUJ24716.1 hypothetical protein PGRAN_02435 [Listeria grandensis FSL F6-0971]